MQQQETFLSQPEITPMFLLKQPGIQAALAGTKLLKSAENFSHNTSLASTPHSLSELMRTQSPTSQDLVKHSASSMSRYLHLDFQHLAPAMVRMTTTTITIKNPISLTAQRSISFHPRRNSHSFHHFNTPASTSRPSMLPLSTTILNR